MTPEEKARVKIDQMFEDAGWQVVDRDFYSPTEKEFDRPSTAQDNDTVNVPVNDTIKLSQLTERQRKIYEIIKSGKVNVPINVPINVSGLATMFNVSEKTIKRDLYVLRDTNLIKYVGSNKKGHWEIANEA